MRALDASAILAVWEVGQQQHPLDRALCMLAAGLPELTLGDLAQLPIGRRDALLLELRAQTFGPRIDGFAHCDHCKEQLEVSMPARSLVADTVDADAVDVEHEGYRVVFRLPTSLDVAAAERDHDEVAVDTLLARVIVSAEKDGVLVKTEDLPDEVVTAVGERAAALDPTSDIVFAPVCPACGSTSEVPFDIGAYLWAEVRFHARRLLAEVHRLAHAYGWREADILALSTSRRRAYLEMLGA